MIEIQIIDPVHSKLITKKNKTHKDFLWDLLKYEDSFFKLSPTGSKKEIVKKRSFFNKTTSTFLTGFIEKIKEKCKEENIELKINKDKINIKRCKAFLKGITFRDYQSEIIKIVLRRKRGVVIGPTGIGKTITFLGIASSLPESNILILCHDKDIIQQTYDNAIKYGFKDVIKLGGGKNKWDRNGKLVISTIQTFKNIDSEKYMDYFDCIIIDEVHRFSDIYKKVIGQTLSPIKIGFTARLGVDKKTRLLEIEGYLGKIIYEMTFKEADERKILAKPKLKFIPVPKKEIVQTESHKNIYKMPYPEIYRQCVMNNEERHFLILNEVRLLLSKNKSSIIFTTFEEHGRSLLKFFQDNGLSVPFIYGKTKQSERNKLKKDLEEKKIKTAIANVWKEGLDITTLDCAILAFGGKSDERTIQSAGRSLRRTEDKTEAIIIDFLDEARYLSEHTIKRLKWYVENGWL